MSDRTWGQPSPPPWPGSGPPTQPESGPSWAHLIASEMRHVERRIDVIEQRQSAGEERKNNHQSRIGQAETDIAALHQSLSRLDALARTQARMEQRLRRIERAWKLARTLPKRWAQYAMASAALWALVTGRATPEQIGAWTEAIVRVLGAGH